jgi:arylsulfatase A-like enzyme
MSERRIFWASVWLAFALVAVKAYYLRVMAPAPGQGIDFIWSLAAVSYRDAVFAAAWWVVARAVTAPAAPRAAAIGSWMAAGGSLLLAAYAAVNVRLFDVFGGFVTASIANLLRSVRFLSGAAAARLDFFFLVALAGAGLAYLPLVELSARFNRPGGRMWRHVAAGTVAAAWIAAGHHAYAVPWAGRQDRRVAENAHWTLIESCWRAVRHGLVGLDERFPVTDLTDFEPPQPTGGASGPSLRLPNVVLLVLESVGARWTSLDGGLYDTTPNLRGESRHGVVFDRFYAHIGRSSNALATLLLSTYAKLDFQDITDEYPRLRGTSLADVFRGHGARTAFLTASSLSWAHWRDFLSGRGFDELHDSDDLACSEPPSEWGVADRCVADGIIDFIDRHRTTPFFVMAWTTQTHYPYEPPAGVPPVDVPLEPGPDQWELGRYLNALLETDRQIGRVFEGIRRAGLDSNTLTIVVGDHGQAFGYPHHSFAQGQTAYEEDVHIPLLIHAPWRYPEGVRSKTIGGQIDLAPTIAALAGMPAAPDWQGRSLFAEPRPPRVYFSVNEDRFILGVREHDWKYLFDVRAGAEELYDLGHDPQEQHNLAGVERERAARLRQRVAAWMEANRRKYG